MSKNKAISMISLVITIAIIIVLAAVTAPLLSNVLNDSSRLDAKEEFANVFLVVQNAKKEILAERYVPDQKYLISNEALIAKFGVILSDEEVTKIISDNEDQTIKAPYKYYLFNQEAFDEEFGNDYNVKRLRGSREYLINFMDELVVTNYDGMKLIEGYIEPISQPVRGEVSIGFSPNGNYNWKNQQSTSVTIKFTSATVIYSASYVWTESDSHPMDSDFPLDSGISLDNRTTDANGNITIRQTGIESPQNVTGNNWYLWVKVEYMDDNEPRIKYEKSEAFFIDNTIPTFDLEVS